MFKRILIFAFVVALAALPYAPTQGAATANAPTSHTPFGLHDYVRWFGSQHSHTNMDGDDGYPGSTAADAFAYAKNLPHLEYFIITPHVHQARSGPETLWSDATYDLIKASAITATTPNFVAIAGQEISTISSGGHWNLYNASALIGTDHTDGDWNDADDYYDHVAGLGASGEMIAAQFNHPDSGDFGFRFDAMAAPYFGTIALSSGPYNTTVKNFSEDGSDSGYQTRWAEYLNLGWKLSPVADQDNHENTWGASTSEYTVIVRPKGTPLNATNVISGLQQHMTYATEDPNMQIGFVANGWSMGQTIGGPANVSFTIWWNNPSGTIYNNNVGVTAVETPTDAIQTIWIYQNAFTNTVATYSPNAVNGAWQVTLQAAEGDWFVVRFKDTYSLSPERAASTKDYTWSAPVWYDPLHADDPLQVEGPKYQVFLPLIAKPASQADVHTTALSGTTAPEYVVIQNLGSGAQDMTGWRIVSVVGSQTFNFPAGYVLAPGASVRIESYTDAVNNPPAVLLWSTGAIWSNSGDKAELYNAANALVDSLCYGNACP